MPAASNVITAAGTQISVSATLPATHSIAGFEALTFIDIGEVVDGGSGGKTFNKVDHSPLGEREVLSLKGSYSQGTRDLSLGQDTTDAGQAVLIAALDSDNAYAFKITYQNGAKTYFTSTVDSYTDDIGTIDSIVGSSVSLALCQEILRLALTGALTASINSAGTGYPTDGTFTATQASTTGSGVGVEFEVTITAGVVAAVSVTKTGYGYVVADTVTIAISGNVPTTPAVIDIDSIV